MWSEPRINEDRIHWSNRMALLNRVYCGISDRLAYQMILTTDEFVWQSPDVYPESCYASGFRHIWAYSLIPNDNRFATSKRLDNRGYAISRNYQKYAVTPLVDNITLCLSTSILCLILRKLDLLTNCLFNKRVCTMIPGHEYFTNSLTFHLHW